MARGGRFQIMEGPEKFQRFVVIEFPTLEQGVACFTSDEYKKAAAFRRSGAGEVEIVMIDGAGGGEVTGAAATPPRAARRRRAAAPARRRRRIR